MGEVGVGMVVHASLLLKDSVMPIDVTETFCRQGAKMVNVGSVVKRGGRASGSWKTVKARSAEGTTLFRQDNAAAEARFFRGRFCKTDALNGARRMTLFGDCNGCGG